jgi:hypothetical protein
MDFADIKNKNVSEPVSMGYCLKGGRRSSLEAHLGRLREVWVMKRSNNRRE